MKIYLGAVAWRDEHGAYGQCVRQLTQMCHDRQIDLWDGQVRGDALVSRSRSLVASVFLRSDADVLLTLDTDIWFRPQDAISLCEKAMDKDIIGALYMTRGLNTHPAQMLPNQSVIFAADQKPVETRFLSAGFMAAHRRVFERLAQDLPHCHLTWKQDGQDTSFWPFYHPFWIPWPEDGYLYLSEDWAFCERARVAGYKIWLDPSIRLGHFGEVMFTLEDLIRPPRASPQILKLTRGESGMLQTEILETQGVNK